MFVPDKRKEGNGAKREGRMFQILTILYEQKFSHSDAEPDDEWLTSTQIARAMGLAPSWYMRDMLHEMAASGWVVGEMRDKANGATAFVWRIADNVEFSGRWNAAFVAWYPEMQQPLFEGGSK